MAGEMVESMELDLIDRISELPEFILHNILSFLDTKEACRAGVLSKIWHEAWSTIPVLDFQPHYFKKGGWLDPARKFYADFYDMETLARFVAFIVKTMERYAEQKLGIKKVYLGFPTAIESLAAVLDRWVWIAVQNQVQELEIEILSHESPEYCLPEVLSTARSLKVLKCKKVKLPNYGNLKLSSLEHLSLHKSVVDENILQRIISSCPLTDLDLRDCWPFGNICVPWMKTVVPDNEMIGDFGRKRRHSDVKTCSLRYLSYYGTHSECPCPFKMNMTALKNLRELEIFEADITDDIVSELTSGLFALETLKLVLCSLLKCIKISSFSLKKLTVGTCLNLEKATIDAPNLVWFSFIASLKPAPSTINVNGELKPALSIINVKDHCEGHLTAWVQFPDREWFIKFKDFLKGTKVFQFLHMRTHYEADYEDVDEEELQKIDSRPPYKLREFKLDDTCRSELEKSSLSAFLDILFKSCHPDVLVIPTNFHNRTLQLILDILKGKVHNWKDPLKGVEFEGVNGSKFLSHTCRLEIRLKLSW